ncbi:metalloprotease [bacterium]|nr:metalloprotease [bacterium]
MRWQGGRQSGNIDDRRRAPGGPVMVGGGLGTIVIVLFLLWIGVDPAPLLQNAGPLQPPGQQQPFDPEADDAQDELKQFVAVVLADTEDVWTALFEDMGRQYPLPKLVLFTGRTQSACGFAQSAMGPFYCPADQQVYVDLSFYDEMKNRFGASGDFAQAYVIAHEIGHHVQNQMGILEKVHALQGRVSEEEYNEMSVRLELQADYLAGVWAHHAQKMRNILEPGDIEEALNAASAIGDDRLQMQSRGYVVPDSFTHGTSEQRSRWFRKGFQSGKVSAGNTFDIDYRDL